jgi:sugar phosphate isomerase/epimerase
MDMYKKGAFINIVSPEPAEWEADFRRIKNLPSRHHVEIWLEYIPSKEERTALQSMLRGTEVIVHGPFIHLSLATHLNALRDISLRKFDEAVEFAAQIGAQVVTFHAGTYPMFETQEIALERLASKFYRFTGLKSPIVTLENMPVRGEGTTRECLGHLKDLTLLQLMIPDIHFTLDIGHCLQNGDDYESFLRTQSSRIANIHLHDGKFGGRAHLRLGAGTLDLPKLVGVLRETGFTKYISLETISSEDTTSSWPAWLNAEQVHGASD